MEQLRARHWRRPYGVRGGAWGKYGPGSRWASADTGDDDDGDDDDDRTPRSRWIERIRDRLMLRQHWLDQALARLDTLEESDGVHVWGAPFYTIGGLSRGVGRRERNASNGEAGRLRAKEERHRRAREREARREQREVSGRSERDRSESARESRARDRDVTRDREDVEAEYELKLPGATRETDSAATSPADETSPASGHRTSRQRSPGSQTSSKTRGRGASGRRS